MKITAVRTLQPIAENSPPDWRTSLGQILVIIETDSGLTGYGVGGGGPAGMHVIDAVLANLLIGEDPANIEDHWQNMYAATLAFGRKGIAIMAISGVDLALWDLKGKAANKPVAELLGGTTGKPLPTYATVWDTVSAEDAASHQAFKFHLGKRSVDELVAAVEQARTAIGPDKDLMVDAWMFWDIETTLKVAEKLLPLGVVWIEEPIPADDFKGYAILRDECPIPIAGGEHEFTSAAFEYLIEEKLHQVLQPDVNWCGGLTELIKIYASAQKAGLRVCPHRGSELWALHAVAAIDDNPLAESGRPWMGWVEGQPQITNGTIELPDAPGLGVIIDEENLPYCQVM